ncbi:hypothetical protein M3Y99_00751700 [Aphelenchoides fujianensis]|nr:hypothetical protein M3Y99_00751700 [Aphelenchoides fujianensis]
MHAFLLLLLVTTIAAVPLGANENSERLLGPNALPNTDLDLLPQSILIDLLQLVSKLYLELQPCIANETAHHANVTEELKHQIEALCSAKAGYADLVLAGNTATFQAVHDEKKLDDECVNALTGLKWKEDPRLNATFPLGKEERRNVCKFLGDLNEQFCRVQEACAKSREQLTHDFVQLYGALHLVATNGTKTDEDCPTGSIPFAQSINPHAFTADFDAHHESLLVPSQCGEWPVPLQ